MIPVLDGYQLVTPASLAEALDELARDPHARPFAGGTDLMVLLEAGRLPPGRYVSLAKCGELRGIVRTSAGGLTIGALTTYTDVLRSADVDAGFGLLKRAAAETGGVATQNRGTLGGNIANASPAADTPPVLLVYDAELELVSPAGARRLPYASFHRGYKQMDLRPGEILARVILPPAAAGRTSTSGASGPSAAADSVGQTFTSAASAAADDAGRTSVSGASGPSAAADSVGRTFRSGAPGASAAQRFEFYRKVGTRRAQAISKVCFAGTLSLDGGVVRDVRIALGSVAPVPIRAVRTEDALRGRSLDPAAIAAAEQTLSAEIAPIDDVRSTARYRARVAVNLLREFVTSAAR